MPRHVTNLPKGYRKRRERPEPEPWDIRAKSSKSAAGFVDIRFRFLSTWLGADTALKFKKAGERFARPRNAPTSIYHVRRALQTWAAMNIESKSCPPSPSSTPVQVLTDLTALRLRYFTARDAGGTALITIVAEWRDFLKFLPMLVHEKAIPRFDYKSPGVTAPNGRLFEFSRDEIGVEEIRQNLAPRSYRFDLDSYNDELFEDVSINASTEEALADFENRLGAAIKTIYDAALAEFCGLVDAHSRGRDLIAGVDYGRLRTLPGDIDPQRGVKVYVEDHPEALANLLALVTYEMGGIPKPWGHSRTYTGEKPSYLKNELCNYVISYGKNRLLPFLGLMTSTAAISCILLLIMEHPNLTASTILNLEVEVDGDQIVTMTSVGQRGKVIDALKLRAMKMVGGVLTPVSELVLEKAVEWTQLIRQQLVADGNYEMAKRLWVGMSARDYHLTAFSGATLTKQIGSGATRRFSSALERHPMTSFAQRHPEISPWASRLNLKALRKNVGVLDYLRSGGNLVRLAKLLGHKSVKTTIKSYVPLALRLALYERQIRRHQNLLLAAAFGDVGTALQYTDFQTTEKLHAFLSSILCPAPTDPDSGSQGDVRSLLERYLGRDESGSTTSCSGVQSSDRRLIINRNPVPLAAAFLYAAHLEGASHRFLDRPDVVTGVPPRFWRDFAEIVRAPLPDALYELHELVREASQIVADRSMDFVFPMNG